MSISLGPYAKMGCPRQTFLSLLLNRYSNIRRRSSNKRARNKNSKTIINQCWTRAAVVSKRAQTKKNSNQLLYHLKEIQAPTKKHSKHSRKND